MSCSDCDQRGRAAAQARMLELDVVADRHGYVLWTRGSQFEFLAVPTGPSHATPEALMVALHGVRWGLPRPPRGSPPRRSHRHPRGNDDGMTTYRLDGAVPPILLTFIDKLS